MPVHTPDPDVTRHAIATSRFVAIVRDADAGRAEATVRTLVGAGASAVELSLVTPTALEIIARVNADSPVSIGAGTVLDTGDAEAAAAAGAAFLVAPVLDADVIAFARRRGLPVLPGVATPTEALTATRLGADFVKVFPGRLWSPEIVRDVLTAMPDLRLVPTGGITLESFPRYIDAGSTAVGLGSALSSGTPAEVASRVTRLLAS